MADPVDPLCERVALAAMADSGLAAYRRNLRYARPHLGSRHCREVLRRVA